MKRLTFKNEHVTAILAETKTGTTRWKDQKLKVGDVVAAVTSQKGKPAFLVPATDAFTHLEITEIKSLFFKDYTEEMATRCGFTSLEEAKAWYRRERPTAGDFDRMHFYGLKVVKA